MGLGVGEEPLVSFVGGESVAEPLDSNSDRQGYVSGESERCGGPVAVRGEFLVGPRGFLRCSGWTPGFIFFRFFILIFEFE